MSRIPVYNRGFTLVETLVAITVLLLVVIGPITVAQQSIKNAYYANEQVTAVFLAQEAIEAIRELRDSTALDVLYDNGGQTWNWIPADCTGNNGCAFNLETGNFGLCDLNASCRIYVTGTGEYNHDSGGTYSGYTRTIYIDDTLPEAISVRVVVEWKPIIFGSGQDRSVVLETWIYDHYQRYGN